MNPLVAQQRPSRAATPLGTTSTCSCSGALHGGVTVVNVKASPLRFGKIRGTADEQIRKGSRFIGFSGGNPLTGRQMLCLDAFANLPACLPERSGDERPRGVPKSIRALTREFATVRGGLWCADASPIPWSARRAGSPAMHRQPVRSGQPSSTELVPPPSSFLGARDPPGAGRAPPSERLSSSPGRAGT
jgi:hypothetical protein